MRCSDYEFEDWLRFHDSAFRGFLKWFHETDPGDNQQRQAQTRVGRLKLWMGQLGRYGPNELMEATTRLFKMPVDQKPNGYTNHCAALLEILGAMRAEIAYSGEQGRFAHRCGFCNDSGMVTVHCRAGFRTTTIGGAMMRDKWFQAACKCELGDQHRNRDKMRLPPYDKNSMETLYEYREARYVGGCDAMIQEMRGSDNELLRLLAERFARTASFPTRPSERPQEAHREYAHLDEF